MLFISNVVINVVMMVNSMWMVGLIMLTILRVLILKIINILPKIKKKLRKSFKLE